MLFGFLDLQLKSTQKLRKSTQKAPQKQKSTCKKHRAFKKHPQNAKSQSRKAPSQNAFLGKA